MISDPLIVMALDIESRGRFNLYDVVHTGLGKVNASYLLTKAIHAKRPDAVINLGSAGSTVFNTGSLVACTKFIQRDIDLTPLGFSNYQTPFEDTPIVLDYGHPVPGLPTGICGTGDSFCTSLDKTSEYNVVDMEAYALAKICYQERIPFYCIKYISDGADGSSGNDWESALEYGSVALLEVLEKIVQKKEVSACA